MKLNSNVAKPNLECNHAAYATKMIRISPRNLSHYMKLNSKRSETESGMQLRIRDLVSFQLLRFHSGIVGLTPIFFRCCSKHEALLKKF